MIIPNQYVFSSFFAIFSRKKIHIPSIAPDLPTTSAMPAIHLLVAPQQSAPKQAGFSPDFTEGKPTRWAPKTRDNCTL